MPASTPRQISTDKLFLDRRNPRFNSPASGQTNAIRTIATLNPTHLRSIAQDIADDGLNPTDLFTVIRAKKEDHYIVLDGNRRIAAIKVLEKPSIIKDAVPNAIFDAIKLKASEYAKNPIEDVTCILFDNRSEANPWISRRHAGQQNGIGPVTWKSDERSRFIELTTGVAPIDTQALNFLEDRRQITRDIRAKISPTALRRLLSTPEIRKAIGIDWKNKKLTFAATRSKAAEGLLYIANDLASGKTNVNHIRHKHQRLQYIQKMPADVLYKAPAKPTPEPKTPPAPKGASP